MKKQLLALLLCLVLTGCGTKEETSGVLPPSPSAEEQKAYSTQVADTLTNNYWKYNTSSLQYSQGSFPIEEAALLALERGGYDADKNKGDDCSAVSVELLHFNEETAGTAYFYFKKDKLLGVYYVPKNADLTACSLSERNLYLPGGTPSAKETDAPMGAFTEQPMDFPGRGYVAMKPTAEGPVFCLFTDTGVALYQMTDQYLTSVGSYELPENLRPISAAFLQDGTLALLCGFYTESHGSEGGRIQSDRVLFLDDELKESAPAFAVDGADYTLCAADGGYLVLCGGNSLRYYLRQNGNLQLKYRQDLGHSVTDFISYDLTGDGTKEYFLTNGNDCYLYHREDGRFVRLWQTHMGAGLFRGPLYAGDLNQDGVGELYVSDNNATTVRYVLGDVGLISQNEDILYGDQLLVADFNGDGKSDYIKIDVKEDARLYLAK